MSRLESLLAPFQRELAALSALCAERAAPAWLVGGTLRDALAGRPIHDVDLVVGGPALELARLAADQLGASYVPLDEGHDVARIALRSGDVIDLAGLRRPTLEADLLARDFTANAIAAPLLADGRAGPLCDPLGGAADIAARRLRLCAPEALSDDPLRVLRAARLGAKLDWNLDPALDAAIRQSAPLLSRVAAERIRQELLALLAQRWSAPWLRYLDAAGVLGLVLPELEPLRAEPERGAHAFSAWVHTLQAVAAGEWILAELRGDRRPGPAASPPAERDDSYPPAFFAKPAALATNRGLAASLQWGGRVVEHFAAPLGKEHEREALWKLALLMHDSAKPATKAYDENGSLSYYDHHVVGAGLAAAAGERLRLSRAESAYVQAVVRGHMRPGQLGSQETTARAAYRFFRDLGEAAVDTLLHALADHLAARGPAVSAHGWATHLAWTDAMLGFHWDARETERRRPLVDGTLLMAELGLKPGPRVGELLEALREAQAAGEIATGDEALALARRLQAQP
ncbi:MAG TPA: HD domain-containing protein [Herpetosiphonaceae bacterium]